MNMTKKYNDKGVNPMISPINSGVSDGAITIKNKTEEITEDLVRSMTFGDRISKYLEDLYKLNQECSSDNWDGYEAKSVDVSSLTTSIRLALSIPEYIPMPDIYVDPDGEIAFEWYEGKRNVFSFSVGSNNKLSYAGLYGSSKVYGTEYFYENIPETIIDNITKLYD